MATERDCGADAAAYVLGALDAAEAEAFRVHMASCSVCQDEVAAFRQVTAALPMAAPQRGAPRSLRRRMMRAVRAESRARQVGSGSPANRSRRPVLAPRPGLLAAAAAVIAIVAVGVAELSSSGGSSRVISASVTPSGASAQVRIADGSGELIVRHFPAPSYGHVYEVWLKRSQRPPAPTSALFSVTSGGAADVGIPGSLHGVARVLVTEEPAGGSLVPTHPPVIAAQL